MSFCIKCEGIGAGRAYVCDQCQNEGKRGTHEKRIAKLEKLIEQLLPKDTVYVVAENSLDYQKWLIRNEEPSKQYTHLSDIDKLRGLKGRTVAVALSDKMRKAIDLINIEVTMGNLTWYNKGS